MKSELQAMNVGLASVNGSVIRTTVNAVRQIKFQRQERKVAAIAESRVAINLLPENERVKVYTFPEVPKGSHWTGMSDGSFESVVPGRENTEIIPVLKSILAMESARPQFTRDELLFWVVLDPWMATSLIECGTVSAEDAARVYLNGGHAIETVQGYLLVVTGTPIEWILKMEAARTQNV